MHKLARMASAQGLAAWKVGALSIAFLASSRPGEATTLPVVFNTLTASATVASR